MRTVPPSLAGLRGSARPWPRRIVRLACLTLPRGASRDRYRLEFLSDLDALTGAAQTGYALRALACAPALRLALTNADPHALEAPMTTTTSKPLRCHVNMHRWEMARTKDGQQFVRCARCLKERDTGPGVNYGFGGYSGGGGAG